MFQQNGLSLDQAPPIGVVFRLFFTASIFGILAAILILFYGATIFDPSSVGAITLTHTLTLGVMASFMLGSLFQMLPVIAGVVVTSPTKKSLLVQIPFIVGTILLLLAFNLSYPILYTIASILLALSLFGVVGMMVYRLLKVSNHSASSKGMILSLLSFGITIAFAIYLISTLSGYIDGEYYLQAKTLHYHFGLFGWVTLLIFSISFQVIEMFYVTPPYPTIVSKYLVPSIFTLLIVVMPLELIYPQISISVAILFSLLMIYFALLTLYRLSQRKRPLADATMWFWRLGLGSLIVSMLLAILYLYLPNSYISTISTISFVSFALSIVFAMFYKIVPFLTWFHLNAQGYYKAPMMHEVIHPKRAKKHFWIHLSMIILLLLSLIGRDFIYLAGIATMISFGWISYHIVYAHLLYKKIVASGEKFDF
jgi:MFS family permease